MQQFDVYSEHAHTDMDTFAWHQHTEATIKYQREVLKYITDIGFSPRLHMDIDALLQQTSEASCKALRFRHSVLYLSDGDGYFRVCAVSGVSSVDELYLREHPLPEDVVAQLLCQDYRISESYFIPAEAPLWQNEKLASYFVIVQNDSEQAEVDPSPLISPMANRTAWRPEDMLVVPLIKADNTLLGFLTPDAPLDNQRPTVETLSLLELFANQAAVAIEGARLYKESQQTSEERAALIEIARVLAAPDALRDLQTVYQTIYEQVRRVMPADAFYISRYDSASEKLILDYFIDEGVIYPLQEYKYYPVSIRKILYQENIGYLFSTAEEFAAFLKEDYPKTREALIGNERSSESLLFTPLRYGDQVLGLLSAQCYRTHAYTRRHLEMLKEISVQASIAVINARLNIELRDAVKRAQESEQLKNHFLMSASHELRTPLTAIQGYLELLDSFNGALDDVSKQRFLKNARRACEELILLLSNVMDTGHSDLNKIMLNVAPMQVSKAVQLILEILEPTIDREKRSVTVDVEEHIMVWADDLRLRQVLLNIVNNALKYTPTTSALAINAYQVNVVKLNARLASIQNAGLPVIITTSHPQHSYEVSPEFIVIDIRDWGPGIGMEDQAQLFAKFMRLGNALSSMQRGAGLGLYLCRQLVEAMDGRIWVESSGISGQGSTFCIALPCTDKIDMP